MGGKAAMQKDSESGKTGSRRRRRRGEEDGRNAGRRRRGRFPRYFWTENGDAGRREDGHSQRPSEDEIVVTAFASQGGFAETEIVPVRVADGTRAGRVTATNLATAHVHRGPSERAREHRECARKRERQDESEHEQVPPSPPHTAHTWQRTIHDPRSPGREALIMEG
jgi:hypothetical protein